MTYNIHDLIMAIEDTKRERAEVVVLKIDNAVELREWIIYTEQQKDQNWDYAVGYHAELSELRSLMEQQHKRTREADEYYKSKTGFDGIPDLGKLVGYLLARAKRADELESQPAPVEDKRQGLADLFKSGAVGIDKSTELEDELARYPRGKELYAGEGQR